MDIFFAFLSMGYDSHPMFIIMILISFFISIIISILQLKSLHKNYSALLYGSIFMTILLSLFFTTYSLIVAFDTIGFIEVALNESAALHMGTSLTYLVFGLLISIFQIIIGSLIMMFNNNKSNTTEQLEEIEEQYTY